MLTNFIIFTRIENLNSSELISQQFLLENFSTILDPILFLYNLPDVSQISDAGVEKLDIQNLTLKIYVKQTMIMLGLGNYGSHRYL